MYMTYDIDIDIIICEKINKLNARKKAKNNGRKIIFPYVKIPMNERILY